MTCSAFLFFGRVIRTPQLATFLIKPDLGNTPYRLCDLAQCADKLREVFAIGRGVIECVETRV
jgi:hypothetical protein